MASNVDCAYEPTRIVPITHPFRDPFYISWNTLSLSWTSRWVISTKDKPFFEAISANHRRAKEILDEKGYKHPLLIGENAGTNDRSADPEFDKFLHQCLRLAISNERRHSTVRLLLERGADPNAYTEGASLLSLALEAATRRLRIRQIANFQCARLLLEHGANICEKDFRLFASYKWSPFMGVCVYKALQPTGTSVYHGNHRWSDLQNLLATGSNPNDVFVTVCKNVPVGLANWLNLALDAGANPSPDILGTGIRNLFQRDEIRPGHKRSYLTTIKRLCGLGANPFVSDPSGKIALDYACAGQNDAAVDYIFELLMAIVANTGHLTLSH